MIPSANHETRYEFATERFEQTTFWAELLEDVAALFCNASSLCKAKCR